MMRILKKVCQMILLMLGVSMVSFLLIHLAPSDPAQILLESGGVLVTEEVLESKREALGLNRPVAVQYMDWVAHAARGDFGASYKSGKPVMGEIWKAMPNTMILTMFSTILTVMLAVPFGIASSIKRGGFVDLSVGVMTYVLLSFPSFFTSLVFLYIFAVKLELFNVVGGSNWIDVILPIAVLALTSAAWLIRQVRALLIKEYAKPYVRACRARGISDRRIIWGHALKNSLLPIITLTGITFTGILGGTLIVENIFNWPGLGQLMMKSLSFRDYPMVQAYVLLLSILTIGVNGLIDILCITINPAVADTGGEPRE